MLGEVYQIVNSVCRFLPFLTNTYITLKCNSNIKTSVKGGGDNIENVIPCVINALLNNCMQPSINLIPSNQEIFLCYVFIIFIEVILLESLFFFLYLMYNQTHHLGSMPEVG